MPSLLADPLRKKEVSVVVASAYVCLVRTQGFFFFLNMSHCCWPVKCLISMKTPSEPVKFPPLHKA